MYTQIFLTQKEDQKKMIEDTIAKSFKKDDGPCIKRVN